MNSIYWQISIAGTPSNLGLNLDDINVLNEVLYVFRVFVGGSQN
jgi:hypothetical protein